MKILFFMPSRAMRFFMLLVFAVFSVPAGFSQSCDSLQCQCVQGDVSPAGIMIGHTHQKGVWMFSYRYMNMGMSDNLSGRTKVDDALIFQDYLMSPASMRMDMHMLMAMYGISDRLSAMVMLNYNVLSMKMNMLPGTMQMQMNGMTMPSMDAGSMTTTTSGAGDTKLYLQYALLDQVDQHLVLSAGLSLPTGNIRLKGDNNSLLPGQRLPYMMQMGSGTYDLLPGLTYFLSKNSLGWGTQLSGTFRPGVNALGYALGNDLTVSTWLAYRVFPWLSLSARAEGYAVEAIYGKDKDLYEVVEPDSKAKNYGGRRASAYAGFNVYVEKLANSRFSIEYGRPFYQNLNGPQLATRSMLYAGWSLAF